MKIILNSKTKTVHMEEHKQDGRMPQDELETEISLILSFAIAGMAKRYFKKKKVQRLYIEDICDTAMKMIESGD